MKVKSIETLSCDAGWRNYHFVKLSTDAGIVGWSEFDEGFGAPGVGTVIERLSARVIGRDVGAHERIYAELYSATRPASGGIIALAMGAIENALLDAKARGLGVPVYRTARAARSATASACTGRIALPGASITRRTTRRRSPISTASKRSDAKCARKALVR